MQHGSLYSVFSASWQLDQRLDQTQLHPFGWNKCGCRSGVFGDIGTMGNTIFRGSRQEEEKIKQISNITVGKDGKKTPFIYIQFSCGAMSCYSESMLMLQVDQPPEEKVRERSLCSRFSAFLSVGKCLVCKDHDLKYIFLVCLERK